MSEHDLPTIKKFLQDPPTPKTISKLKHWSSRRHHGVVPKDSPVSEIESHFSKKYGASAEKRASISEKHAFKRELWKEEDSIKEAEEHEEH
ncbi:hypothetical protein GEMRC1_003561 [Eukaryota sp. GEM-RC1]